LPLTILMLISILVVGFVATVVASDTGELAFYASPVQSSLGYGASDKVFWRSDNLPSSYPFFDLKINITDVTDLFGVVVSVHWDPTILNCTNLTPGDFLPAAPPQASGWLIWKWDYSSGNMEEAANCFLNPYGPTSVSKPNWGWVMTLTFEFVGSIPTVGSHVDTDVLIVDEPYPPNHRNTLWVNHTHFLVEHDFDYLSSPYVHTCHFHYEAHPPPVGGEAVPIYISMNNLETPTLWIWLTTIILSMVVTVVYVKKRKRNTEINS
jgi:hypothetical protein